MSKVEGKIEDSGEDDLTDRRDVISRVNGDVRINDQELRQRISWHTANLHQYGRLARISVIFVLRKI